MRQKLIQFGVLALAFFVLSSFAQAAPIRSSVEPRSETTTPVRSSTVFEYMQLSPVTGFTAISSRVGFNLGVASAFRLTSEAPLFFEPSFVVGFFSNTVQFGLNPGMRFDVELADTRVRPFFRVAAGPIVQTEGENPVFNAALGPGILIPTDGNVDVRLEANFVDIDGAAGFQFLGGVTL